MLRDGYTRAHRSTWSHPIVGERRPLLCLLWFRMISMAYFRESGGLKRGQFKSTFRQLADLYGIPLATFRDFKNELVAAGMITVEPGATNRQPSTFTIVNYDLYQCEIAHTEVHTDQHTEPTRTSTHGNTVQDSERLGAPHGPAHGTHTDQHTDQHTLEKENSKKERSKNSTAPSADPGGPGEESAKPKGVTDELGKFWPSPPKSGVLKKYPEQFEALWSEWGDVKKATKVRRFGEGKAKSYSLLVGHLKAKRLTADQINHRTTAYIASRPKNERQYLSAPKHWYRQELLEFENEDATPSPPNLRPWSNPISAFVEINRAARKLGLPLPTFGKFSATWEQIESMPDEVLELARANA